MDPMISPADSIDYNKVIAEFIDLKLNDIISIPSVVYTGTKKAIQLKFKTGYSKYLEKLITRYAKSRSFFIREEAKDLYSFYVPVGIKTPKVIIKSANLRAIQGENSNCVICGSAGSGKSMLLKHLLINSLRDKIYIPIFIELRDFFPARKTLFEYIHLTLNEFDLAIDEEYLKKAFLSGHFLLFLDGLDEIPNNRRSELIREIDGLQKKYSSCSYIISSRPDQCLQGLQAFSIMHTLPFTLEQSISLIQKLPAEEEIKDKFIRDLQASLFKKHREFLSNPLLLSIMLLTYGYSADIPNKISIFYNQAYEALFQRHDALKGAYKRIRETDLDISEFSKVFSVFCLQSYDQRKFQFSRQEALVFLDQAKGILHYNFDNEAYINDLLQSVCLLIEDGLLLTFSHRSFQEYFAALFIVTARPEIKKKLVTKYQGYVTEDNVFKLLHEMDQDFIEYDFVLPFLNNLTEQVKVKKKVGITHYLSFIKLLYTQFNFKRGDNYSASTYSDTSIKQGNIVRFIFFNICRERDRQYILESKKSEILKKYMENSLNGDLVFETSKLTTKDELVVELYKNGLFFSKRLLEVLINLKEALIQKKEKTHESLEKILLN